MYFVAHKCTCTCKNVHVHAHVMTDVHAHVDLSLGVGILSYLSFSFYRAPPCEGEPLDVAWSTPTRSRAEAATALGRR